MSPIPEVLSAKQLQNCNVLTLRGQRDTQVLKELAELGYDISPPDALENPPYIITVFGQREVELPSFRVDGHIREQLIDTGVTCSEVEIARVYKFTPGGQFGAHHGGLYFYPDLGPIVVSTTGLDALQKVTDAFRQELRDDTQNSHPENLLQRAVIGAMGATMMSKRESIPVAVLTVPGGATDDSSVARYFPDSKVVVDEYGQLLNYSSNDQKQRAAMIWKEVWPAWR